MLPISRATPTGDAPEEPVIVGLTSQKCRVASPLPEIADDVAATTSAWPLLLVSVG
jgi:hypothetical protein